MFVSVPFKSFADGQMFLYKNDICIKIQKFDDKHPYVNANVNYFNINTNTFGSLKDDDKVISVSDQNKDKIVNSVNEINSKVPA